MLCSFSHVQLFATLWTVACQALLSMGILQARWRGLPCPPSGDLPNPGIDTRSPKLHAHSLPSELPGRPKNTRVGSLSLLQGIFLTQGSNRGLLHCRWILYQLNYQGSPFVGVYKISCLGQHSGNYFSNAVSPGVTTNKPVFQE